METTSRNDPEANEPESRLALVLLRYSRLMEQGDFARAARVAPSQLSVYERGDRATPREVLERPRRRSSSPSICSIPCCG